MYSSLELLQSSPRSSLQLGRGARYCPLYVTPLAWMVHASGGWSAAREARIRDYLQRLQVFAHLPQGPAAKECEERPEESVYDTIR